MKKIMVWEKYRHLIQPGAFIDKWTSGIDFKDEAVVEYDLPVVQTFMDDGNLQIITDKFWCK